MKNLSVSNSSLAVVTGLCLAAAAQAQTYPFNAVSTGPFQAYGVPPAPVPVSINHPSVTVNAPFAFSSLVATQMVDFSPAFNLPPGPPAITGSCTFTTGEGLTLLGAYSGILVPTADPMVYSIPGTFTFTGGTGSFAGATGGGQLLATVQFADENLINGNSQINWNGNITIVPEPQALALWAAMGLGAVAMRRVLRARR